jgi:hypothetical protein
MSNTHTSLAQPAVARQRLSRILIGFGLLALSAIFIQLVLAQNTDRTLKPPYHLNLTPRNTADVILPPPSLDGQILVSETFDSNYSPTSDLNATGWHQVTGTLAENGYTWGRVISGTYTDSAWAAATALNGETALNPGTDPYTNGMQAMLIYGPLDLSDDGLAVMTATYLLDSQPGDSFGVAVSTDGTNFDALTVDSTTDPLLGATHSGIYNLHAYAKRSSVWVAFYFVSNSDESAGLGAFINEVVIRATPLSKIYMPLVVRNYPPTPTPSPTPSPTPIPVTAMRNYTFSVGTVEDPQFLEWGGTYAEDARWGQAISTDGHPDGAVNLNIKTLNDVVAASPNVTATDNYTYSADIYVVQGKRNARIGLIFGASLTTFGRDDNGHPTFDPNRNFYKFDLQFSDSDSTLLTHYRLLKCQNGYSSCTLIVQKGALPTVLVDSTWINMLIVRNGNSIIGIVNGTQLFNTSDTTFTDQREFGIFVESKDLNSDTNPLKIRFDNVEIFELP